MARGSAVMENWMLSILLVSALFAPQANALLVHGAVVGPDDAPTVGARVVALREDPTRTHVADVTPLAEGSTDSAGRFTLSLPVSPPSFRVIATADGFAPAMRTAIGPHDSSMAIASLRLLPAARVTGQIFLPDGSPAAGATLRVDDETGAPVRIQQADQEGAFALSGLPRGPVRLAAHAEGSAWNERTIDLADSHRTRTRIELLAGVDLHGVVRDPDGAPVPGAEIRVQSGAHTDPPAGGLLVPRMGQADEQGRFLLTGLPTSAPAGAVLSFRHKDHPNLSLDLATALEGPTTADDPFIATFARGVSLVLAADVTASEPPVFSEARFEVFTPGANGWRRVEGLVREEDATVLSPSKWRIVVPSGGIARVQIIGAGGELARAPDLPIADHGADAIPVSFEFPTLRALSGVVRGPTGVGVPNMQVEVAEATSGPGDWRVARTTTSGPGGVFSFDGLPPGGYSLRARASEFLGPATPVMIPTESDISDVDLQIKDAAFVEGVVQVGGKTPTAPVVLNAFRYQRMGRTGVWRTVASALTDPSGRYRIGPIPPGRLLVVPTETADTGDGAITRHLAERDDQELRGWKLSALAKEGESARLDIEMDLIRRGYLSGVVTVNDAPRPGVQVMIRLRESAFFDSAITDPEGRFRLRMEGGGPFLVETRSAALVDRREVDPEPGTDLVLGIAIAAGSVSGSLQYVEAGPEPARLLLESPRTPTEDEPYPWEVLAQAIASEDGSFAFSEVTTGRYRVTVQDVAQTLAQVSTAPFQVEAEHALNLPALRVPRGVDLEVTMTKDKEGRFPFAALFVRAADGEPELSRVFLGWFVEDKAIVHSLPPGRVLVTLKPYGPWIAPPPQEVSLRDDGSGAQLGFLVKPEPEDR